MNKKIDKKIIILLALSLMAGIFWNQKSFGQTVNIENGDESFYHRLAVGSFDFKSTTIQVPITPLYPLFIKIVYFFCGVNFDAVRIAQLIVYMAIIILIYKIGKELTEEKIAFTSALITLFYFPLAMAVGKLNREILFTFVNGVSILFLILAIKKNNWKWYLISFLFSFLPFFVNGVAIFIPVAVGIGFIFLNQEKIKNKRFIFIEGSIAIFIFFVIFYFINPGPIKSAAYEAMGALSGKAEKIIEFNGQFTAHFIGQIFGYYFAEKYNPTIDPHAMFNYKMASNEIIRLRSQGMEPTEASALVLKKNTEILLNNPHKLLAIYSLHLIQFNSPYFINPFTLDIGPGNNLFIRAANQDVPEFLRAPIVICYRVVWLLFLFFVIFGMIVSWKKWRNGYLWLFILIIYFNAAYTFVYALPRYAIPIYPYYILLFTIGFFTWFQAHCRFCVNILKKYYVIK